MVTHQKIYFPDSLLRSTTAVTYHSDTLLVLDMLSVLRTVHLGASDGVSHFCVLQSVRWAWHVERLKC